MLKRNCQKRIYQERLRLNDSPPKADDIAERASGDFGKVIRCLERAVLFTEATHTLIQRSVKFVAALLGSKGRSMPALIVDFGHNMIRQQMVGTYSASRLRTSWSINRMKYKEARP